MEDTEKEVLLKYKEEAEKALKNFGDVVRSINSLGFKCQVMQDNSLYIFRDTRESIGEMPQMEKPQETH